MSSSLTNRIERYAVSPSLLKDGKQDGVIASLVGMAPTDKIKISGNTPALPSNYQTNLSAFDFDASMAFSLGFSGLVGFKGTGSVHYLLNDFSAMVKQDRNDDSIILAEYYAVGYRIAVKAWDVKTKTNISLSTIAADCTVNGSSSAIQIETIGLTPSESLAAMPGLSGMSGNFDMSTLQMLGSIGNSLKQFISDNYATLTPSLVAVDLDLSRITDAYENSASTILGLSGIAKRNTFTKTMDKQPDPSKLPKGITINSEEVKKMYQALMGADVTDTAQPNDAQKKVAKKSDFRGE